MDYMTYLNTDPVIDTGEPIQVDFAYRGHTTAHMIFTDRGDYKTLFDVPGRMNKLEAAAGGLCKIIALDVKMVKLNGNREALNGLTDEIKQSVKNFLATPKYAAIVQEQAKQAEARRIAEQQRQAELMAERQAAEQRLAEASAAAQKMEEERLKAEEQARAEQQREAEACFKVLNDTKRPHIGVMITETPEHTFIIKNVCAGGPAAQAGLIAGMQVLKENKHTLHSHGDLVAADKTITTAKFGNTVSMVVLQDGKEQTVKIQLPTHVAAKPKTKPSKKPAAAQNPPPSGQTNSQEIKKDERQGF